MMWSKFTCFGFAKHIGIVVVLFGEVRSFIRDRSTFCREKGFR